MATQLYELPSKEEAEVIAEKRKSEAQDHWNALCQAGMMHSSSSMHIGYHAQWIKANNLFGILGFGNEDDARKASGVGRSTWYDNIRIAEAFQGLSQEQFCSMKQANAKAAMDLPESKRLSREWVRLAGVMKIDEFAEKVDEELRGKARPSDGKEPPAVIKMDVPVSRKKAIEEGLKQYGESVGVTNGDLGRSLELLVAEKTGQRSLTETIANAAQILRLAKDVKNSDLSAEEALETVYGLIDDAILELGTSLQMVQNLDSED